MSNYLLAALCLSAAGACLASDTDTERGRRLYENQCVSCHESVVHIRENRRARGLGEVYWQTTRWTLDQKLDWRYEEVRDVAQYLNNQFYKFDQRMECR